MTPTHKVHLVLWHDTVSDNGWKDVDEAQKLITDGAHLAYSVGVIIHRDKKFLYLAADWGYEDNPYNRILIIPRGMVKKVKLIHTWRKP